MERLLLEQTGNRKIDRSESNPTRSTSKKTEHL